MSYPLKFPDDDPRFSPALILDVANVLKSYGYPSATEDADTIAGLRAALAGFLYGPAFNNGDKVTWMGNEYVWTGRVDTVANTSDGQVARIITDPQPGSRHSHTVVSVIPCRELTLVRDGAR